MTAIYIRTVNITDDENKPEGRWTLPEGIDVEKGIQRLTQYAKEHGYDDLVFFLDDAYDGSRAWYPAFALMNKVIMNTEDISEIIVSDLHQIAGGLNVLAMFNNLVHENNIKLMIAAYDMESGDVLDRYYDEWVVESVENSIANSSEEDFTPAEEAFELLKNKIKDRKKLQREDLKNAAEQEARYTEDGYRVINAETAIWLLKTKQWIKR